MPISRILINVEDVARSVEFYRKFLHATVVESTADHADLDLVTATIRVAKVSRPAASTWIADDLQRGFRHLGFKVDAVDPLVAVLDAAGVTFHLRPIEAVGGVRIAFFFDPDGTLLELVERDLDYHEIADEEGVARERALGTPNRPRFDHVALTSADAVSTRGRYAALGFGLLGAIHHTEDPRGFEIEFLKGGDTVLEVFTYTAASAARAPQLDAPGFSAVPFSASTAPASTVSASTDPSSRIGDSEPLGSTTDGQPAFVDPDGLVFAVTA